LIITGTGGIWIIVRRRKGERTEASSSRVSTENNNRQQQEDDYRFTPKKVLAYCIIVGLIRGILYIFIDWLHVLSMTQENSGSKLPGGFESFFVTVCLLPNLYHDNLTSFSYLPKL
jgi:hypothetical protein